MLRQIRRIVIAIAGGVVLVIGVAMIILPGPAIVVIPAGLAILATEFAWARRLLHHLRSKLLRRRSPERTAPPRTNDRPRAETLRAS